MTEKASFLVALFAALFTGACGDSSTDGKAAAKGKVGGMKDYDYLACEGGPHIVLPKSLASQWKGHQIGSNPLNPATDYGRACNVSGRYGLISVGSGKAFVLADPPMSAWAKATSGEGMDIFVLEMLSTTDLDALIERAQGTCSPEQFADSGLRWELDGEGLSLLFAGDKPGSAVYGEHSIPTQAGTYAILEAKYQPSGRELVRIYRLRRIDTQPDAPADPEEHRDR